MTDRTLESLVKSLGRNEVSFFLREKYQQDVPADASIRQISETVHSHPLAAQITGELDEVRSLAKEIDANAFKEMAIEAGIQPHASDSKALLVLRVFVRDQSTAEILCMMAQAVNQVGFDEHLGRTDQVEPLVYTNETLDTLQTTLKEMVNEDVKGQKCIVKVRQMRGQVLMVAYLEQQQRKIYQAGEGDQIAVTVIKPLAKTTAIYLPEKNRLKIHASNNKRIQRRIAESFGRALFRDTSTLQHLEAAISTVLLSSKKGRRYCR